MKRTPLLTDDGMADELSADVVRANHTGTCGGIEAIHLDVKLLGIFAL